MKLQNQKIGAILSGTMPMHKEAKQEFYQQVKQEAEATAPRVKAEREGDDDEPLLTEFIERLCAQSDRQTRGEFGGRESTKDEEAEPKVKREREAVVDDVDDDDADDDDDGHDALLAANNDSNDEPLYQKRGGMCGGIMLWPIWLKKVEPGIFI